MKRLIIISFFAGFFLNSFAQLTADFEADSLAFCPPYTVQFHDKSIGSGIIARKWVFGPNNIAQGNNKNPVASYVSSGLYNVTLKVYTATDSAKTTKSSYITVYKNPKPQFSTSTPLKDCPPLKVSFTDQTSLGDAPIASYTWTFGDNSAPSNSQNPTHTYTQPGIFNVGLAVVDTNGCKGAFDSTGLVEVFVTPKAAFSTVSIPHHCLTPLTVNFINQTTGPSGTTFAWDLGNGTTSTVKDPTETYQNPGSFNVTLIATSPNGCTDTLTKNNFVSATTTMANFTLPSDTVCVGESFQVSNQSVGGNQVDWDFGDGTTYTIWEPSHTYNATGVFTIQLIVAATASCRDTIQRQIHVIYLNPSFTVNKSFSCETPFTVKFTPDSNTLNTNGLSYYWESGEFGVSNQSPSPSFTYTKYGTFSPKMVVTSKYGCEAELTLDSAIHIFEIIPNIGSIDHKGCAPLAVNLEDLSTPKDSVYYRFWDFGDTTFYGGPNQSRVYTTPGDYTVYLTVGTRDSCEYITSIVVEVGIKQNALFTIDTNLACASDSLTITNLSTDTSLIDEYLWAFGDGQTSNIFDPRIAYKDTGFMDISLIVLYNGCPDTMIMQQARRVLGPVNIFNYTVDCSVPYDIQFNANVLGGDSIFWDFGDTLPNDTNTLNPIHTYYSSADYTVSLYSKNINNGCENEFKSTVKVRDVKAAFSISDSIGCLPFKVQFDASDSKDEKYGSYTWLIDTAKVFSSGPILNNTMTIKGYYPITLIVSDDNLCKDTAYSWMQIFDPEPDFAVDTFQGCVPFQPQFTDLTKTDTNLVFWNWDFWGGITLNSQNPQGNFTPNATKWYDVTYTVRDTFGCENSITRKSFLRAIKPPLLLFTDPFLCENEPTLLENMYHQQGNTYFFDFGNGDTSNQHPANYAYANAGKFDLLAIVTDSNGCVDSTKRFAYMDIQAKPNAQFFANPTDTSCYPAIVEFNDSTMHNFIASRIWNFGDGSTPITTTTNPIFKNYTRPGKYDVELIVETTYGCLDTLEKQDYISIDGPFAKMNILDDTVCTGQRAIFALDSAQGILETKWDFGDGLDTILPGNLDTSYHKFLFPGKLVVRAFMIDTALKCPKFLEDTILIHLTEAAFGLDKLQGCVPLTINSNNQSTGADKFKWQTQGVTRFGLNFNHTYQLASTQNVKLVALDSLTGCADSIDAEVVVFPLPDVRTTPQQTICIGDSIRITASGGISYRWSPSIGLSQTNEDTVMAGPTNFTKYQVTVTDKRNCVNTGFAEIEVVQKPKFTVVDDTSIYLGELANLWVNSSDSINALWTPSTGVFCPNCIETQTKPVQSITYTVYITDYNGCFTLDTNVTIEILNEQYLFIPNAFSPNGDGINDEFEMVIDGFKGLVNFQIFDRWGTMVFQTDQIGNFWDGTVNGSVVENSNLYNYQIILETYTGDNITKKGFVTIVK